MAAAQKNLRFSPNSLMEGEIIGNKTGASNEVAVADHIIQRS